MVNGLCELIEEQHLEFQKNHGFTSKRKGRNHIIKLENGQDSWMEGNNLPRLLIWDYVRHLCSSKVLGTNHAIMDKIVL